MASITRSRRHSNNRCYHHRHCRQWWYDGIQPVSRMDIAYIGTALGIEPFIVWISYPTQTNSLRISHLAWIQIPFSRVFMSIVGFDGDPMVRGYLSCTISELRLESSGCHGYNHGCRFGIAILVWSNIIWFCSQSARTPGHQIFLFLFTNPSHFWLFVHCNAAVLDAFYLLYDHSSQCLFNDNTTKEFGGTLHIDIHLRRHATRWLDYWWPRDCSIGTQVQISTHYYWTNRCLASVVTTCVTTAIVHHSKQILYLAVCLLLDAVLFATSCGKPRRST